MNFDKFYDNFIIQCKRIKPSKLNNYGKYLFLAFIITDILVFFAPLFNKENVWTAIIGCVLVPYITLIWRYFDKEASIVPTVFLCISMVVALIIYLIAEYQAKGGLSSYYLTSVICTFFLHRTKLINLFDRIKEPIKMYLAAGGICVVIVIIACFISFLVSKTWWIICLLAFLAIIAFFFTIVLGTAAYTATDDKRQARKKYIQKQNEYRRDTYIPEPKTPEETIENISNYQDKTPVNFDDSYFDKYK